MSLTSSSNSEQDLDLALAAAVQAALLPTRCPSDCPHQVAAARNRMCRTIGGDFYDFVRLNDDQWTIVIGDVVGHGVRAALVMSQIMGFLRSPNENRSRPAEFIKDLNRMLVSLGERTGLVTPCSVIYAVVDAPTGLALLVNAGHPSPHLCDRNACSVMSLVAHDMLLGVQDFEPTETCFTLSPAQRVVLYTDGLTDAANGDGERFEYERLYALINQHASDPPDRCADAVFDAVEQFRDGAVQSDDETVVVIDRV